MKDQPLEASSKSNLYPLLTDTKYSSRFSPGWRQTFASLCPIIACGAVGMTYGYSSILLAQLNSIDSNIQLTNDQSSWIASIATMPMSLACIFGGLFIEKAGRKTTLLFLCVSFAVGWIILAVANSYAIILLGRFITGLSSGFSSSTATVYLGETTDPKYRGIFLAGISLSVSLGIFIAHIFGTFFHWKTVALYCSLFMILSYALGTIAPDSPSWLLSKGFANDAENSFRWLRGCDEASLREFDEMVKSKTKTDEAGNDESLTKWQSFQQKVVQPEFWKPLVIVLVYFFTTLLSGAYVVAFYAISVMKDTMGSDIDEYLAMIITDIVRVLTSFIACILLRVYGRRPLTFFSGIGTSISLILLAIFLIPQTSFSYLQNISWVSLTLLISYIVFVGIGLVPLPWCLTGELFPVASRGILSGLSASFNFISFFFVIKTAPSLFASIGVSYTFMIYGVVTLVGTVILFFILPETKNITLQEIENRFKNPEEKKNCSQI